MEKKDIRIGVVTVSDRAFSGERADLSGPAIRVCLEGYGYSVARYILIDDDYGKLKKVLQELSDDDNMNLILTTGGTGLAPRDVTPEATLAIADKVVPGIAEAIRAESLKITKNAMISRGVAVIRKGSLIINLPGSPKACRESIGVFVDVIPHAVGLLAGEKVDK